MSRKYLKIAMENVKKKTAEEHYFKLKATYELSKLN